MAPATTVERLSYGGWPNCYRLTNGIVDLVMTTDVGPRVIRLGFCGAPNEFHEYTDQLGKMGGDQGRIYGGHRLWHAPEEAARTYVPDNGPVSIEQHAGFVRIVQPVEPNTGIQKEIDIRLTPAEAHAQVTHRLRNTTLWPVELAPWAISVMAPGGTAIIPLPPRGTHPQNLRPSGTIALWPYTDMRDPRWTWGGKYVLARHQPGAKTPQKAGAVVPDGWCAYARAGHLFVVGFDHIAGATYPDLGCTAETWMDADMLEVETLGPLTRLEPGAAVEHCERWFLFADVPVPQDDDDVDRSVLPRVHEAGV